MTSLPYLDKFSKLTILIFGILIGAIISFILFVYLPSSGGDIHFVQSISSHYSKENKNCDWRIKDDNSILTMYAIKDVKKGEEILTNYGNNYWKSRKNMDEL